MPQRQIQIGIVGRPSLIGTTCSCGHFNKKKTKYMQRAQRKDRYIRCNKCYILYNPFR